MSVVRMRKFLCTLLFLVHVVPTFSHGGNMESIQQSIETIKTKLNQNGNDYELQIQLVNLLIDNSNYSEANVQLALLFKNHLKKPEKRVELYLLQARVYSLLNANNEAITYLIKAKETAFKTNNHEGAIRTGIQLMEFYRKISDYVKAERTYYQYSFLAKKYKLKNPKLWNGLYNRFAAVNNEISKPHLSIHYSKLAIKEGEKINDKLALAISYNEMGFSYKNLKNNETALENYRKAEDIYQTAGAFRDLVHIKMNILYVQAHAALISQDEISQEAEKILALIDKEKVDYPRSKPLELIRNYYEATRQYEKAYFATNIYNNELTNEARRVNDSQITEIVEQYQNTKLKRQNEVIKLKAKNEEERLQSTKVQLFLVIGILVILTVSFLVLNYFFRKSKRQNKLLDEQNVQKSLLIQEIHHRVKNNLQFVHSMLEMQKNSLPEDDKQSFQDLSRRINAMSLIHEQLYLSNDQEGINIQFYMTSLMKHTSSIFESDQHIEISIDVPEIDVPVDKALPIGIICAELFNNAVKHAFTNHSKPKFNITLYQKDDLYVLKVTDNGSSSNEKGSAEISSSGLGTRLVDIFSRQLKGEYWLNKENGYEYVLEFKI